MQGCSAVIFSFDVDDPVFVDMVEMSREINDGFGTVFLADIWPIFKYFPPPGAKRYGELADKQYHYMAKTLQEHRETYNPGDNEQTSSSTCIY